jgi:hypothetical protein
MTRDVHYLYLKLKPILQNIDYPSFERVFRNTVNPEVVHSFKT